MYRRSEKWLGSPFSADTLASGGIRASSGTNASYRDGVTNRLGSNFRENGMSPKAQLNTSELATTAAIAGRLAASRRRARARSRVPTTKRIRAAEEREENED